MPDRDRVIKGLEELYGFLFREYANIPAEESKIYYERTCAIRDSLVLLKEPVKQEPIKPRVMKDKEWGIFRWSCGNCGYNVGYPHMANFCSKCGKQIDWYKYKKE